jgi:hypothetical protein
LASAGFYKHFLDFLALSIKFNEGKEYNSLANPQQPLMAFTAFSTYVDLTD